MSDATELVKLKIDGQSVSVPAGTTVVDAAHQMGVEIPIFCHHPRMEPVGMCRMCLVEVGTPQVDRGTGEVQRDEDGQPIIRFFPKLQTGCTMRVSDGMVVKTATEAVSDARRSVLEFLLTSHPLDCPVCDKGGECPLQNLTMRYGPGQSRFTWGEKFHFAKPVPIGPLIALDRERCVLCARCIRFEDEIADNQVLGFENRGRGMEIISVSDPPFDSYFSGNTSDICPVGALTTTDFRFESRVWEHVPRPGVCGHCPVGCNLTYDTRQGEIMRVMPRENDAVNEIWLCDKGRFAHHYADTPTRIEQPLIRRDGRLEPASWDEALSTVARRLRGLIAEHGGQAVGGIAGGGRSNEDLYAFGRFLRAVVGSPHVDHVPAVVRDDLLLHAGAGEAVDPPRLAEGTTVIVAGLDVEEEAPVLYLNLLKAQRRGARVVVLGGRPQALDPHATALRYQYGGQEPRLVAALARAVLAERGDVQEGAAGFEAAMEPYDVASLEGHHPVHEADMAAAAQAIAHADDVVLIYGQEATELGLQRPLAALLAATGHLGRVGSGLLAVGPEANSQGAADMGLLPGFLPGYQPVEDEAARQDLAATGWPAEPPGEVGMDAATMLAGGVRALLLQGCDPVAEDAGWAERLAEMDLVVAFALFPNATTEHADVVLPSSSLPEMDGTVTSLARRVQRTYAACDPHAEAQPDWRTLRDLAQRMGVAEPWGDAADVTDEIARAVPTHSGLDHAALGPTAETAPEDVFLPFAPQTAARHVSYEGTSYDNVVGEGLRWPTLAARQRLQIRGGVTVAEAGAEAEAEAEAVAAAPPADATPGGEVALDEAVLARLWAWQPSSSGADADSPEADGASGAASAEAADGGNPPGGDGLRLTLVAARRLYDRGPLMAPTENLRPLVPPPGFEVSPFDASAAGLADGARVRVEGERGVMEGVLRVRDHLTPGTLVAVEARGGTMPVRAMTGGQRTVTVRLRAAADQPPHALAEPPPAPAAEEA